jgi:glucose-6-phosphate isomerase
MVDRLALWRRFCDQTYWDRQHGIMLDLSRLEFTADFFSRMQPAIDRALEAMAELEAGSIANDDEERMVGHYWLRAPDLAPDASIAHNIRDCVEHIKHFAQGVHTGNIRGTDHPFTNLLVIGIGGSALGPQLLADALGRFEDALVPYFLDNTDPDGIDRVLGRLLGQLDQTLVVVISKSGGTPETRNGMLEVKSAYERTRLLFHRFAVAITQPNSALDRLARDESWLARFPMWEWVGGRTSVTSAVGLLPAALQGLDIDSLLSGAAAMDEATRRRDFRRNPAALLALAWFHAAGGAGKKDLVILPYKDRLQLLARYLQQLIMESLGKERDRGGKVVRQGLTVYGNKGSTDQHSYVQQLRDGLPNFFVTFIEVLHDRQGVPVEVDNEVTSGDYLSGFLHGTRHALFENGRESITITLEDLTPATLGQLLALYERTVGLYAELINVNAYHQPGVQAGKVAAQAILDLQREVARCLAFSKREMTAAEVAEAVGKPDFVEDVFRILLHLSANPWHGVMIGQGDSPANTTFQPARS